VSGVPQNPDIALARSAGKRKGHVKTHDTKMCHQQMDLKKGRVEAHRYVRCCSAFSDPFMFLQELFLS